MLKLTFDLNCVIDLEKNEGEYASLRDLVAMYDSGEIEIAVSAVAASERLPNATFADNFRLFRQRIQQISNVEFNILKPTWHIGICYFDWIIFGGAETDMLEKQIFNILFPHTEPEWKDQAKKMGLDPEFAANTEHQVYLDWRNKFCDTLSMFCHIYYQRDIFVTRDNNFHKQSKKPKLIELGARQIINPGDVLALLQ